MIFLQRIYSGYGKGIELRLKIFIEIPTSVIRAITRQSDSS
jgi:hypothetical protein